MAYLSEYKIYWIEITPTGKGRAVTKPDIRKIGAMYLNGNKRAVKHFGDKEKALAFIKSFDKPLQNRYKVRLFTDKQYCITASA